MDDFRHLSMESGSNFLDSFVEHSAPIMSPDPSWMDLIDHLIEAPLMLNEEAMMISPIPTRRSAVSHHDELKEEEEYFNSLDCSSIKRPKSALDVPSSSSPNFSSTSRSFATSSFIPNDVFPSQQHHELDSSFPIVPSIPAAAGYDYMSHSSTVPMSRATPPLPNQSMSPSPHSPSPSPLKKPPSRSKSTTNNRNKPESGPSLSISPSLTSPMQALLDQDPSMLLQGTKAPHMTTGLQLVHMLLACAEAFAQEKYNHAKSILMQLHHRVSPSGDSIHRVAAYFTDALHSRLAGTGHISYHALRAYDATSLEEILAAYHILYQVCPYIKFAHFTSNQAIFEAFEGQEKVHIIDLEILQGYQWPAFMQALAARPEGAPRLRITGVGMPLEAVQETGKRLADLAESLHVPFQYHAVGERLENLEATMLQRRPGEALAVNSINRLHRLFYSSDQQLPPLLRLLHMIREQDPTIVTLVEQESSHNGQSFLGRFLEALQCYSAIFDSLEATLPQSSPERTKVEQVVFASEIANIVACEGEERIIRHEKLEKWQKIMEGVGFQNVPLSQSAIHQSHLLLGLYPCEGYTLCEDRSGLLLGWQDRALVGASAWRC